MSVTIAREPTFRAASRERIFAGLYQQDYDDSTDGKRFLMIEPTSAGVSFVAIPNCLTGLKQLTRSGKN